MTGMPQLCDKELQCISEPQLQLNKTTRLSEISSWESTHSHSPTLNRSFSNLRFPHASFLCTNIAKKSQITELAKHTRVKHGHEQCFPKDWPKSQNCFEDEPKNEQQKGSCPQDAPGNYLLKEWHHLGTAYPKQHVHKESVAMRRWSHIMPEVYPKPSFRGVRELSPSTTH